MSDFERKLEIMQRLLRIASEITMMKVNGQRPSPETIIEVRNHSKEIADANLYPFCPTADEDDLIEQVLDFASKVDG